jgi:hypothetical protein
MERSLPFYPRKKPTTHCAVGWLVLDPAVGPLSQLKDANSALLLSCSGYQMTTNPQ